MSTEFTGTVKSFNDKAGYGYIQADDGQQMDTSSHLLVHRHSLHDRSLVLKRGDAVCFRTELVPAGTLATDVRVVFNEKDDILEEPAEVLPPAGDVAFDARSRAILARDNKNYEDAARLYDQALRQQPSVGLILSYAAMEKNRNRRREAMQIYMRGIRLFPNNAKLQEDAGVLAFSMRAFSEAITFFEKALHLSRAGKQGTKGVLLKLAQVHYQLNTIPSLSKSLAFYREALPLGSRSLTASDLLQMNIAAVRTQHSRGNVTLTFLEACGFRVTRAELHTSHTESADLCVQQTAHAEFVESYGLAGNMLVRCFFKASISHADIVAFDEKLQEWAQSELIDEQVALIVVGSLPQDLQRILSARIEQKSRPQPAIVPITQSEIETSQSPLDTLRTILDRWLFRRDLFATNSPVSGSKFFGRDKPLAEIRDAISSSTCAGVYGLRKVGKTSLLQESRRRSTEVGHLVIYIDLLKLPADVNDNRWLYWRIANALREEARALAAEFGEVRDFRWRLAGVFPDFLDVPDSLPVATAFDSDISRFIDVIRNLPVSPRPKIVLLLDEIERLLPSMLGKVDFTGFFDLLSYMRGLNQERPEFIFIVTGANASISEVAQFDGRDNPVFNYLKEIYLPHQESNECFRMIRSLGRGMGLRFAATAEQRIYRLTGGHPFFARQLCSYIAEVNPDRPFEVTLDHVDHVVQSYLDSRSSHFGEIVERLQRDYPDELGVCEALARAGGELSITQVREISGTETIKHLTGYQIVRIRGDFVHLSMELLTKWLQKRMKLYDTPSRSS
jgi:tetratricopeptide (TPR) repeat protein/AAA+ ATPase superfamily predicted ATPase